MLEILKKFGPQAAAGVAGNRLGAWAAAKLGGTGTIAQALGEVIGTGVGLYAAHRFLPKKG